MEYLHVGVYIRPAFVYTNVYGDGMVPEWIANANQIHDTTFTLSIIFFFFYIYIFFSNLLFRAECDM